MADFLRRLLKEEEGASIVEYGLLIAGIAVLVMGTIWLLGGQINTLFLQVLTRLGYTAPAG